MGTDQIVAKIKPVLLKYGVRRAELFGSAARGEMNEKSDVDILVDLPEETSLSDLGGLYMDLRELLERNVDVVEYGAVNSKLAPYVFMHTVKVI